MKYVVYIENIEGINVYDTLAETFLPRDSASAVLRTVYGVVSIAAVEDSTDLSEVTESAKNLFRIQEFNLDELRLHVYSNSDMKIRLTTGSEGETLVQYVDKGDFDELEDHINPLVSPYETWVWNAEKHCWLPPLAKPNLSAWAEMTWNHSTEDWDVEVGNQPDRKYRGFQLWKSVPVEEEDLYSSACSTTEYMIKSFESVTHSTAEFDNVISSTHGISSLENKYPEGSTASRYPIVDIHEIVLDLSPEALVSYSVLNKEYVDQNSLRPLLDVHPQCAAHTIEELFRLIIEWAWAYTELGNAEPMAESCHNVLKILQMPLEVRQALIDSVPEQAVARYLRGDQEALNVADSDPGPVPAFSQWMSQKYKTYAKRQKNNPLNVQYPLYDYEV